MYIAGIVVAINIAFGIGMIVGSAINKRGQADAEAMRQAQHSYGGRLKG